MRILREEVWSPDKRITVEVLVGNQAAQAFYRAVGFAPYSVEFELLASEGKTQPALSGDADKPRG